MFYFPMCAVIDIKNVTVTLQDAGDHSATVIFDEGNFTHDEAQPRIYVKDRGKLSTGTVKNDDEEPMSVQFGGRYSQYQTSGGGYSINQIMKGNFDGAVSTSDDLCEPYCCDIILENVPGENCGESETLTYPMFRWETGRWDVRGGTVNVTGKCKALEPVSDNV